MSNNLPLTQSAKTKVLFFATNVKQYNGYSYAIYELACQLAHKKDIELTLFGFQNFYYNPNHVRQLPPNVYEYDAFANETPKQAGFGFEQVTEFVTLNKPDVCIIYNDMVVVSNIINQLYKVPNKNFKIIVYIDQVYLYQKKEYIDLLNKHTDYIIAFTPFWETCAINQGITLPTSHLQHGFNPMVHYPFPKHLARKYYGIKEDDFIILNLNRNQPRKRWDICLQAFAEIVKLHQEKPVKLLIATALQGAWNLIDVFERELKKRNLTLEDGMKHIIIIDNPQQLTDEEINILYNLADIGVNTCDGEGFGLCNFQQAAIGIPQVVPAIGGFLDFFNDQNSQMIEPAVHLYIESSRDGVGGESQVCDYKHFVEALNKYITDPELLKHHGTNARASINKNYKWEDLGDKLHNIIRTVCAVDDNKQHETQDEISPQLTLQPVRDVRDVQHQPASQNAQNEPKQGHIDSGEISLDDISVALSDIAQTEPAKNLKKTVKFDDATKQPTSQKHLSRKAVSLLKARKKGKHLLKKR